MRRSVNAEKLAPWTMEMTSQWSPWSNGTTLVAGQQRFSQCSLHLCPRATGPILRQVKLRSPTTGWMSSRFCIDACREHEAHALLEICTKKLDETHAGASGIEPRLYREFEVNMHSWDHEFGEPQNISDQATIRSRRILMKNSQNSCRKLVKCG